MVLVTDAVITSRENVKELKTEAGRKKKGLHQVSEEGLK